MGGHFVDGGRNAVLVAIAHDRLRQPVMDVDGASQQQVGAPELGLARSRSRLRALASAAPA
jgi:hypothetical protein